MDLKRSYFIYFQNLPHRKDAVMDAQIPARSSIRQDSCASWEWDENVWKTADMIMQIW